MKGVLLCGIANTIGGVCSKRQIGLELSTLNPGLDLGSGVLIWRDFAPFAYAQPLGIANIGRSTARSLATLIIDTFHTADSGFAAVGTTTKQWRRRRRI